MNIKKVISIIILIFYPVSLCLSYDNITVPHNNTSFSKSKKLMEQVYYDNMFSFYCNCQYSYQITDKSIKAVVDNKSCGYMPRKNQKRGKYIEWEHVVLAWAFGNTRKCWREEICTDKYGNKYKGRKCCTKIDKVFKAMEADMYNLYPAVGELNADRKNYKYGIIPGEERKYGACDFEVADKLVEPKENIRGDIARTYFYMEKTYNVPISDKQRKLFEVWDKQDKIDEWEIIRAKRIEKIQGNRNTFVIKDDEE